MFGSASASSNSHRLLSAQVDLAVGCRWRRIQRQEHYVTAKNTDTMCIRMRMVSQEGGLCSQRGLPRTGDSSAQGRLRNRTKLTKLSMLAQCRRDSLQFDTWRFWGEQVVWKHVGTMVFWAPFPHPKSTQHIQHALCAVHSSSQKVSVVRNTLCNLAMC